jgi:hypothetical protein
MLLQKPWQGRTARRDSRGRWKCVVRQDALQDPLTGRSGGSSAGGDNRATVTFPIGLICLHSQPVQR